MLLISTPLFFRKIFLFNQFVATLQGQPLGPCNLRLERFILFLLSMLASSVYVPTRAVVGLSQEVYSLEMEGKGHPLAKASSPVGCSSISLDNYLSKLLNLACAWILVLQTNLLLECKIFVLRSIFLSWLQYSKNALYWKFKN